MARTRVCAVDSNLGLRRSLSRFIALYRATLRESVLYRARIIPRIIVRSRVSRILEITKIATTYALAVLYNIERRTWKYVNLIG